MNLKRWVILFSIVLLLFAGHETKIRVKDFSR